VERVASRLKELGVNLALYDPYFVGEQVFGIKTAPSAEEGVKEADCIVVGTAHAEFLGLDPRRLAALASRDAALVDARNVFDPAAAEAAGFKYLGVGRRGSGSHEGR
jgi:UDP-N-acetyl-D-mannosaminuronate dehydrogenase